MSVALVTGANGFIGSHLTERLLAEGHRVRCLVRPTSDRRWIERLPVEFVVGDLTEPGSPDRAVSGVDWVFHLGGVVKAIGEAEFLRVNAEGTRRLGEAAARARVARFILLSSLAAVGPSPDERPLDEECVPRPVSAYGRSKLAAEAFALGCGAPAVVLRPPAVYGPRDRDVLPFFRLAARGIALVLGEPRRPVSLIHVSDLVAYIVRTASATGVEGQTYFVSDGAVHVWSDVVETLARTLGRRPRRLTIRPGLLWLAACFEERRAALTGRRPLLTRERLREFRGGAWVCDGRRAREELGMEPRVALGDGLAATAAWYREHGWL